MPNDPSSLNPDTAAGLMSPLFDVAPDSTQKFPIIPQACCGVNSPPSGDIKKLKAFSILVFPSIGIDTEGDDSSIEFVFVSIFGIEPNTKGSCEFFPSRNIPKTCALIFNCEFAP